MAESGNKDGQESARATGGIMSNRQAPPDLLSQSDLFALISPAVCRRLAEKARSLTIPAGNSVYLQGQPFTAVYLIECGAVRVSLSTTQGNDMLICILGRAEAVGVLGLPAAGNYPVSARTLAETRVLAWRWQDLQRSEVFAPIQRNAGHIVSRRLAELESRFRRNLSERDVHRSAGRVLAALLPRVGLKTAAGVELPLSLQDLAQLSGASAEEIKGVIDSWSERHFARQERDCLIVADPERLAEFYAK